MLYVSKKARNVRQDRFDNRFMTRKKSEPVVIEPTVIENDITPEKVEPTVIEAPVETKRKAKKTEKVDKEEKTEEDGRE